MIIIPICVANRPNTWPRASTKCQSGFINFGDDIDYMIIIYIDRYRYIDILLSNIIIICIDIKLNIYIYIKLYFN